MEAARRPRYLDPFKLKLSLSHISSSDELRNSRATPQRLHRPELNAPFGVSITQWWRHRAEETGTSWTFASVIRSPILCLPEGRKSVAPSLSAPPTVGQHVEIPGKWFAAGAFASYDQRTGWQRCQGNSRSPMPGRVTQVPPFPASSHRRIRRLAGRKAPQLA